MAALDCYLELDPVDLGSPQLAQPPAAASAGAPALATPMWGCKRQQQLKTQVQAVPAPSVYSDASVCTSSPGCSYSGAAGLEASLLDLADDACSAPPHIRPLPAPAAAAAAAAGTAAPPELAQQQQQQQLLDGTPLVTATFFDDLAAKGSLYQYCLQR